VARLTSDDRPANGTIEGPQDSVAREVLADGRHLVAAEQSVSDRARTASGLDPTAGDGHPTASEPSTPTAQTSTIDAATVFAACRELLQGLLGDRADITVVEHAIAGYPLDDEEKATLWLWAIAPFDPATLSRRPPLEGM
jgi:hypothetical protein